MREQRRSDSAILKRRADPIIHQVERLRESDLPVFAAGEFLNGRELLRCLRLRIRFILGVSTVAGVLALIVSLCLPKEYTAVASVLIDSPAGSDPRLAVAVNPAYIESLRAYELLASSDSLFLRAVDEFHLRESGPASLDRMKRRILRVAKIRDTRLLNIAVTLPDAKQAQAVAQFLAGQMVILSRSASEESDNDLLDSAQRDFEDVQARLQREQAAWGEFNAREPEQPLSAEIETMVEARSLLQSDLIEARANAAAAGDAKNQARVRSLESDDVQLDRRIREASRKLAQRGAMADQLQQRKDAAQASFNAAAQRVRELRAQSGMRGERLRLFDAGVVPDRPSSPNLPLNVAVAFAGGLLCSIVYLGVTFDLRARRIVDARPAAVALLLALYATAIALADGPLRSILAAAVVLVPLLHWILVARNAWLGAFFVITILAPPFPIALGNSGPHPAVILAALGLFIGFLRRREWSFTRTFLPGVLALFVAVLLLSTGLAAIYSGVETGAASLARSALAAISVYVFSYVSAGPGRAANISPAWVYAAAVASAAFACVDFFYQFPAPAGFGSQFIWLDSGVYRRAQGLFYEAGTLGNFCAFGVVVSAVALVRGARKRVVLIAGMTIFAAALILSYSRASALNALVALSLLAFLERNRFTKRGVAYSAATVVACGSMIYAIFPDHAAAYGTRFWFSVTNVFSYGDRIFGGRLEFWATLLRFLAANPWHAIFGVGYKTLPYSDFIGERVVADNMYLSMLVETGIVGLGLLLAMNVAILRTGYRAARSQNREKSFYGTAIFCFWAGQMVQMVSADVLTFWRVLPLYFWVLAMAARR